MTRTLVAAAALFGLAAAPPPADDGEAAKERLRVLLRDIIARQKLLRDGFYPPHLPPSEPARGPQIGEIGPVLLRTGETRTLRHTMSWRKFPKDELAVKVEASDPTITVPAELKLDFEKHQFRFEYELKAGAKTGTFEVKLTPEVGPPVVVTVTVK